jgi:excisionase family DNA binding protein
MSPRCPPQACVEQMDQKETTVTSKPDNTKPTTAKSNLIDPEECAARLGVTLRHIRRLVQEGRIPYIKWGSRVHFDPVEIDAWIDEHRRRPRRLGA